MQPESEIQAAAAEGAVLPLRWAADHKDPLQ